MNSYFAQYKASLEKNVIVIQKINSFCQELLVLCHLQINFILFELQSVSVTLHDNI